LEIQDERAGPYEIIDKKYFSTMSTIREYVEDRLGELRVADVSLEVYDFDRKFRDTILKPTLADESDRLQLKASYEEKQVQLLDPKALDLNSDATVEYAESSSADFDMNGPEEVSNAGFETDTTGWTLNSTSIRSSTVAHSGTWSLKDDGPGTPNYNELIFTNTLLHSVTAEVWVYIDAHTSGNIALQLLDAASTLIAETLADTGITGAWQKLVINTDSHAVKKIRLTSTGIALIFWDDVSVTRAYDFTIACWVNPVTWPSGVTYVFEGLVDKSGTSNLLFTLEGTESSHSLSAYVGSVADQVVVVAPWTGLNVFRLAIVTLDRTGNLKLFLDGVEVDSEVASGIGRLVLASALTIGRRNTGAVFPGLLGEVIVVKGLAIDAYVALEWYNKGIRAPNGTIGFYRWLHNTDMSVDYSGRGNNLTLNNIGIDDRQRERTDGEFAPYVQRAQDDETLFYGYIDFSRVVEVDKTDVVRFTAYSPLKRLEEVSILQLYNFIQANNYERYREVDAYFGLYFGRGVKLRDILYSMARLAGLASVEIVSSWLLRDWLNYEAVGIDKLWVLTQDFPIGIGGITRSVFDEDLQRSPLSFFRFGNCKELLKDFQLSLFSFAHVRYYPETDVANLIMKQRGSSVYQVKPNGRLLDHENAYETVPGVLVQGIYQVDIPDWSPGRTQLGSFTEKKGFQHDLALKTAEQGNGSTLGLHMYEYWHVEITPTQGRGDIQLARNVVANGWPEYGETFHTLSAALANAYFNSQGGRRQFPTRKFHRLTGTRNGDSSVQNMRPLEHEEYLYRGELKRMEIRGTDLDPFKNEATLTGIVL